MDGFEWYVSNINLSEYRPSLFLQCYVKFPLCEHGIIGSDTVIKAVSHLKHYLATNSWR